MDKQSSGWGELGEFFLAVIAATCALVALVCGILLLLAPPAQAEEPPQDEDPREVHMDHYAQLSRWEREFARPRSAQLWQEIVARPRESFRNDRARVEYILALRPTLRELRTLTQERTDAILAGYCLDKDAAESSVLELMHEFGNTAIRLADQAVLLEFARTQGVLWGRDRRRFRSTVVGHFFEEVARFDAMRARATQVVDAMYQLLALTNGEDSACAALYSGADWADRSSWYLYQPSLGWPLAP